MRAAKTVRLAYHPGVAADAVFFPNRPSPRRRSTRQRRFGWLKQRGDYATFKFQPLPRRRLPISGERSCRFRANALGAGGGNRTPRLPIGFGRSTIKLHRPKMWPCYPAALRTTTKTFPAQQFLSPLLKLRGFFRRTAWMMPLLVNKFIECPQMSGCRLLRRGGSLAPILLLA